MTDEPKKDHLLRNQSVVRFSSGEYTGHSYSNIVLTQVNGPQLIVRITASETIVSVGQTINYKVHVVNKGNLSALVTLIDFIPLGTDFVANSVIVRGVPFPEIDPSQGIPLGLVGIGEGESVDSAFQVIVTSVPASGNIQDQATASYSFTNLDGRVVSGSVRSNTSVIPVRELQISVLKQVSASWAIAGDTLTYSVTVQNETDQRLEDLIVRDHLPAGVAFVPGSVTVGKRHTAASLSQGICLAPLPPGAKEEVTFQVKVEDCSGHSHASVQLVNEAELHYCLLGTEKCVKSNSVVTRVLGTKVSLVKSVDTAKATIGDSLCYSLVIVNEGSICIDNAVLSDMIPAGSLFEWGSVSIQGVSRPELQPAQGIPLGTIEPHQCLEVSFRTKVPAVVSDPRKTAITNQALLAYSYCVPDGRTINASICSNSVTTHLYLPFIKVEITPDPPITEPGGTVAMTCCIANTGNLAAHITLHDWIPEGSILDTSKVRINGSPAAQTSHWETLNVGVLPPHSTAYCTYILHVKRHPHIRFLSSGIYGAYRFELHRREHSGISYANEYRVWIEHWNE